MIGIWVAWITSFWSQIGGDSPMIFASDAPASDFLHAHTGSKTWGYRWNFAQIHVLTSFVPISRVLLRTENWSHACSRDRQIDYHPLIIGSDSLARTWRGNNCCISFVSNFQICWYGKDGTAIFSPGSSFAHHGKIQRPPCSIYVESVHFDWFNR